MGNPISPRRLVENEVFFRQKNRSIEEQFKKVKKFAIDRGQFELVNDDDIELQFFCECSDENCKLRITLQRSEYDNIHKANDMFVVISGHELPGIERIIEKADGYSIVQKKLDPPQSVSGLNPTPIANV